METILITGSHGQLGNEMQQAAVRFPQFNYIYTDVEELDICDKAALDAAAAAVILQDYLDRGAQETGA